MSKVTSNVCNVDKKRGYVSFLCVCMEGVVNFVLSVGLGHTRDFILCQKELKYFYMKMFFNLDNSVVF